MENQANAEFNDEPAEFNDEPADTRAREIIFAQQLQNQHIVLDLQPNEDVAIIV